VTDRIEFETFLKFLNTTRRSICEGMMRAIELVQYSRDVVDIIANSVIELVENAKSNDELKPIYARLYLISDILFNT
jgi:hypothetical protein